MVINTPGDFCGDIYSEETGYHKNVTDNFHFQLGTALLTKVCGKVLSQEFSTFKL